MTPTLLLALDAENLWIYRCTSPDHNPAQLFHYPLNLQASFATNLSEALELAHIADAATEKVCVYYSNVVVPVPISEFSEADTEALYQSCFAVRKPLRVCYDALPAEKINLLFGVPTSFCKILEETFGVVEYRAALTPLLHLFSKARRSHTSLHSFFVVLHSQTMDVVVYESNRLQLINRFDVSAVADRAYFIFNIAQKLRADLEHDVFILAGDRAVVEETEAEFRRFATNIQPFCLSLPVEGSPLTVSAELPIELQAVVFA